MEKISINNSEEKYEIEEIRPVSENVLLVKLHDQIPDEWGDITVYTDGGYQCSNLPGFSTVYRDEGKTIYLSNDSSVYTLPEEPGEILPAEPYVPTLEERKAAKKAEVAAACENTIYDGVEVKLENGETEHFSLTEHDQLNLFGKQAQLASGVDLLEYHADGQPCRYYSAADMQAIINAAMFHVSYHTTYCNSLNMWIAGCETEEELETVSYGAVIPENYRSEVLQAYIVQINEARDEENETPDTEQVPDSV